MLPSDKLRILAAEAEANFYAALEPEDMAA